MVRGGHPAGLNNTHHPPTPHSSPAHTTSCQPIWFLSDRRNEEEWGACMDLSPTCHSTASRPSEPKCDRRAKMAGHSPRRHTAQKDLQATLTYSSLACTQNTFNCFLCLEMDLKKESRQGGKLLACLCLLGFGLESTYDKQVTIVYILLIENRLACSRRGSSTL